MNLKTADSPIDLPKDHLDRFHSWAKFTKNTIKYKTVIPISIITWSLNV